jgi:hypothetical protein
VANSAVSELGSRLTTRAEKAVRFAIMEGALESRLDGFAAFRRRWLPAVLVLAMPAAGADPPASADRETPVCVGAAVAPQDALDFVTDAIEVLEACGHDPAAYRLELNQDDPFELAGSGREPTINAVFVPLDSESLYAVGVGPADPCVVSWIWQPAAFTPWQRDLLEGARRHAEASGLGWTDPDGWNVRVTESRELVSVRLWPADESAPRRRELRFLLEKRGLRVVSAGESGGPAE